MRLLTRYVLFEVLQVFLATLGVLTVLMMMFGVIKEAVDQGLGLIHVAQLIPYVLPNALLFAVPGTILFAVANVYSRMSGSNEIVAIKALGISPVAVLSPILVLAVLLSFFTVWLNDVAVSWGYRGAQQVVLNAVEDIAYGMLTTNRSYQARLFSINVRKVEGRKLIHPTFSFKASGDSPAATITAEEAELHSDPGSGVLSIRCRNGEVNMGGNVIVFPDTFEHQISLDEASMKGSALHSPSHLSLGELPEQTVQQRVAIDKCEQGLAAQAAYLMLTGNFGGLSGNAWATQTRSLQGLRNDLYRLQTEPPRRWANGFSCFCFTLVGATLAMRRKNGDPLGSFFMCFLPVLLVYYPLLVSGVDRAKSGAIPPYAVWLANLIFLLWGCWLLRRVIRY
jgi:lipopolysaccharide export system permease protein